MQYLRRLEEWMFPQSYKWLIKDIDYFMDEKKYPSQSPLQEQAKNITWNIKSSLVMGVVGTVGLCISIRRNSYGKFTYFSIKRSIM